MLIDISRVSSCEHHLGGLASGDSLEEGGVVSCWCVWHHSLMFPPVIATHFRMTERALFLAFTFAVCVFENENDSFSENERSHG